MCARGKYAPIYTGVQMTPHRPARAAAGALAAARDRAGRGAVVFGASRQVARPGLPAKLGQFRHGKPDSPRGMREGGVLLGPPNHGPNLPDVRKERRLWNILDYWRTWQCPGILLEYFNAR